MTRPKVKKKLCEEFHSIRDSEITENLKNRSCTSNVSEPKLPWKVTEQDLNSSYVKNSRYFGNDGSLFSEWGGYQ
jgi:hypothetical protein